MTDRIDDLSERRRRINARPWHLWQPDQEAHVKRLNKLLEEAYEQKRRQNTEPDIPGGSRARTRRHG